MITSLLRLSSYCFFLTRGCLLGNLGSIHHLHSKSISLHQGFLIPLVEANALAIEMGIEPIFPNKRPRVRKKQYDESSSKEVIMSREESFRVFYFNDVMDNALTSFRSRFEQFEVYQKKNGFLFDVEKLRVLSDESLKDSCYVLEEYLKKDTITDIDGKEMLVELKQLWEVWPHKNMATIEMVKFLKEMDKCYPNVLIAYRVLRTYHPRDGCFRGKKCLQVEVG
ncbi:hypothetical protein OROMI_011170 [Orobanche minor]